MFLDPLKGCVLLDASWSGIKTISQGLHRSDNLPIEDSVFWPFSSVLSLILMAPLWPHK